MSQVSTSSPLAVIRDKERALGQEIRLAEEHAAATVTQARARAEAIKTQAESEGMREAEALYQNGLAQARQQADATRVEGEKAARQLLTAGTARIGKAVDHILAFILPHTNNQ